MKLRLKYHNIFSLAFLIVVSLPLSAQQQDAFFRFDSLTYRQYLDHDWKNLIKTSKEAFAQGFDYYYLRMRAGIAQYERGNYMKAFPQFRKALAFNSIDVAAREYMYYTLSRSGRQQDALIFYKNNESTLKDRVQEKIRPVRNFSFDLAW
ncbi:MAG TPA: hypothetical protein VE870_02070, partial [Bacteroidales bacterium]|nr:hypothetical protein [Bacteroidales bacterium]